MSGILRHRITIQRRVGEINQSGFTTDTWEDVCTVWAGAANLHGREFFAAKAVQAEQTVKFTIRYRNGLDTSMRIVFDGKPYNITAIDNIQYRNQYLEIKALEVDTSGH